MADPAFKAPYIFNLRVVDGGLLLLVHAAHSFRAESNRDPGLRRCSAILSYGRTDVICEAHVSVQKRVASPDRQLHTETASLATKRLAGTHVALSAHMPNAPESPPSKIASRSRRNQP